jgi:hypothetical protein
MRKKFTILSLLLILLLVLSACTAKNAPSWSEMTPKQKLAYMYQVYNAQHEDYMAMAANPNLTDGQKRVLRSKKPILQSLQLLIPAYDQGVQLGNPTFEQEQQIYNLLTQLQTMTVQ